MPKHLNRNDQRHHEYRQSDIIESNTELTENQIQEGFINTEDSRFHVIPSTHDLSKETTSFFDIYPGIHQENLQESSSEQEGQYQLYGNQKIEHMIASGGEGYEYSTENHHEDYRHDFTNEIINVRTNRVSLESVPEVVENSPLSPTHGILYTNPDDKTLFKASNVESNARGYNEYQLTTNNEGDKSHISPSFLDQMLQANECNAQEIKQTAIFSGKIGDEHVRPAKRIMREPMEQVQQIQIETTDMNTDNVT